MTPSVASSDVARALREIGALLRLEPGNRFKSAAYERGADVVEQVRDLAALAAAGSLTALPGIGRSLAGVVLEILRTGKSSLLEKLRERYPPGTAELSKVLSLPRAALVHRELGVLTLDELREACEQRRVRELPGFGAASEQKLLERIDALATRSRAVTIPEALRDAERLVDHLRRDPAVLDVQVVGDLRRRMDTISRIDLVVASKAASAVARHAARVPGSATIAEASKETFVLSRAGALDARVDVVPPSRFAAAVVRATGSEAHVRALESLARERGLALEVRSRDEVDLYRRLGLDFVPPELREGAGEVEAAAAHRLPRDLLETKDLRGAVHCHTTYSDGNATIEEMARGAEALGLDYLTITDHSASATYARGLEVDRLRKQADEIRRVQPKVRVRLLHGTESDILKDGSLDYPDDVLAGLDVVVASIHERFRMDEAAMTARVVRAMRHPLFKIWGHARGRYVLSRPPFACRMPEILDAIAESCAAIEVNGDPNRLDLDPFWIREARARGIRFVVSADAHSVAGLRNLRFGVDMARRGWLSRSDVLNTLEAKAFAAAVSPRGAKQSSRASVARHRAT
jgi:DNA polymerase (family 10)